MKFVIITWYYALILSNETNCLADVPQSDNSLQNKRLKYPGQIYSLDEQCSMVYGEGSHFCGVKLSLISLIVVILYLVICIDLIKRITNN